MEIDLILCGGFNPRLEETNNTQFIHNGNISQMKGAKLHLPFFLHERGIHKYTLLKQAVTDPHLIPNHTFCTGMILHLSGFHLVKKWCFP